MTDITVPEVADYRDDVKLSCSYVMGTHALNSVKWYKNELEFFRYVQYTTTTKRHKHKILSVSIFYLPTS